MAQGSTPAESPMSPAPGVPQTPTKAIIAALIGFIGTFVVSLSTALAGKGDENITGREWAIIILGALATTIVAGGLTFQIANKPT